MRMIACLIAGVATTAGAQPAQCERTLLIGGWNIQWLGNAKSGNRSPQTPEDIASYIAASKVDVLALSEISNTGTESKPGNATLNDAMKQLSTGTAKWHYRIFPKREGSRAPTDQWVGIAWNEAAVQLVAGPTKLAVDIDPVREAEIRSRLETKPGDEPETVVVLSRTPYVMKFSAGKGLTDFAVVPIHSKSNIGGKATADARGYEAELIKRGLEKLRMDADIVIMGDSNMLDQDEPAGAAYRAMGLKDCNARNLGTHIAMRAGEKAAPFDRIFVMENQPETAGSCPASGNGSHIMDFKIVRPADWIPGLSNVDFRKRLSDHLLVRTGICVMKDDD